MTGKHQMEVMKCVRVRYFLILTYEVWKCKDILIAKSSSDDEES